MSGWFITGTDTGVGKTFVTELLLQALTRAGRSAIGIKPIASGARHSLAGLRNDDAERLLANSSVAVTYEEINPYIFAPPIAPHLAAAQVGVAIDLHRLQNHVERLRQRADHVVVEGAGGWRVPLGRDGDMAALAKALGLPVVLVVGVRLGCINHALLTAEAIRRDGCRFAGWIANRIEPAFAVAEETEAAIAERISAPLTTLPCGAASAAAGDALLRALIR